VRKGKVRKGRWVMDVMRNEGVSHVALFDQFAAVGPWEYGLTLVNKSRTG
jgi:hypothetical protein